MEYTDDNMAIVATKFVRICPWMSCKNMSQRIIFSI